MVLGVPMGMLSYSLWSSRSSAWADSLRQLPELDTVLAHVLVCRWISRYIYILCLNISNSIPRSACSATTSGSTTATGCCTTGCSTNTSTRWHNNHMTTSWLLSAGSPRVDRPHRPRCSLLPPGGAHPHWPGAHLTISNSVML